MKPIFYDDEDDFTPQMAKDAMDRFYARGPERERELGQHLKQASDGTYRVPFCAKGDYADFYDQANYNHFTETYPWLEFCTLDPDKRDRDWYEFLTGIDDEQWEQFLEEVDQIKNDPSMFSEEAWELEMKETTRYWTEDGHWDLLNEICDLLDDAFKQYCVRTLTSDDTWEFLREHELYPESQGDGSVFLNEEEVAKKFDWDEYFADANLAALRRDWLNQKRLAWAKDHGDIFRKALAWALEKDKERLVRMSSMEERELFHLFVTAVGDKVVEDQPCWRWHGYEDKPENRWIVALTGIKSIDSVAMPIERGCAAAAMQAEHLLDQFHMPGPEEHPELPLQFEAKKPNPNEEDASYDEEDWDLEKASEWMKSGGYDSATVVYKDDLIRVIIPRTIHTLKKYIPTEHATTLQGASINYRDILICIPSDANPMHADWGHLPNQPFVVYETDDGLTARDPRRGNGQYDVSLSLFLADVNYGKALTKALLTYYRKALRGEKDEDERRLLFKYLLQIGGFRAIQRSLHRYPPGQNEAFDFMVGLAAAKVGNLPVAVQYFGDAPEVIQPEGFVFIPGGDWSDCIELFAKEDRRTATSIFDGDLDWLDVYQEAVDYDDLENAMTPELWAELRGALINRHYTDQETGESVLITRQVLEEIDDADLWDIITEEAYDENDKDLEDVRDQLGRAYHYALESAYRDAWYAGAVKALEDALGPSKWATFRNKESLQFMIPWKTVEDAVLRAEEDMRGPYDGSLHDLIESYGDRATLSESYSPNKLDDGTVKEALANEISELSPLEQSVDPNQLDFGLNVPTRNKWVHVSMYGPHYPNGATIRMREADYVAQLHREPWRFDKELWDQHAAQQPPPPPEEPPAALPAPGLGESVDPDEPETFLARYSPAFAIRFRMKQGRYNGWKYLKLDGGATNRLDLAARHSSKDAQGQLNWYQGAYSGTSFELVPVFESLMEGAAYKYGCAMLDVPPEQANFLIEWGKLNVPDNVLYTPDESSSVDGIQGREAAV